MVESSHDSACRRISQRPGTCDDVTVGYWLTKYTLGITLKILFRSRAWGVKNMPRRGPVILASNHLSFSDHFFGPFPVPRKVINRKSTRLNSSHVEISYAVFCLKKKKKKDYL